MSNFVTKVQVSITREDGSVETTTVGYPDSSNISILWGGSQRRGTVDLALSVKAPGVNLKRVTRTRRVAT